MIKKQRIKDPDEKLIYPPNIKNQKPPNEMLEARANHGRKHFDEYLALRQKYCDEVFQMSIDDQNYIIESLEACQKYKLQYKAQRMKIEHLLYYIKIHPNRKSYEKQMQSKSQSSKQTIGTMMEKLLSSLPIAKWFYGKSKSKDEKEIQNQQSTLINNEFSQDRQKQ